MQAFGDHLKTWRSTRRFSQLDLGLEANVSARHVSFLESGRARPSREMVIRLAQALEMPREAANAAMRAAGFAEVFPSLPAESDELKPVRDAVRYVLERHTPLPAIAINRAWDVLDANAAAIPLFGAPTDADGAPTNVIDRLIELANDTLVENWIEVAMMSRARLQAEIVHHGGDADLSRRLERLNTHPRLENADMDAVDWTAPVIPVRLKIGEARLSVFSTIAQFSTVQDVHAAELRIELMFPADDETKAFFGAP